MIVSVACAQHPDAQHQNVEAETLRNDAAVPNQDGAPPQISILGDNSSNIDPISLKAILG